MGSHGQQSKRALLIIDVQNDFCPPTGALAVPGGREIAPVINDLLEQDWAIRIATRDFHPHDHISFATQHPGCEPLTSTCTIKNPENPEETQQTVLWPPHCVQGTPGCELIDELEKDKIDVVIDKGQDQRIESYSGLGPPFKDPPVSRTRLEALLKEKEVNEVFVVGIAYDYCVKCTAIDAADAGFKTTVLEHGCKAVQQDEASLNKLRQDYEDHGVQVVRGKA
ncbi:Isochorismatase hydrolase [Hortaea werneckii]|uniref:nicotinamidase n=2 Tax=Hortaea werneckii TaxID=91943 RepID=A0A3M7IXA7_HORWE|nr:Isochorismatase hydrolase [Hortaea werneckii]OTA34195.1 hypothetical protein BTJ68_06300 [Hortaea werneckii EXF-2000]KAI6902062.1 Isochorismatase hydrolase [Hortaea werneckii]KAI6930608.1 Isochorismatase hydrolase [Hortaea werneckii]KAI6955608.1 Isochorismatase hydrolase [Hortaea werneckii]